MQIIKPGKYRLTKDYTTSGSFAIAQIPAGSVIEITQVDLAWRKVIGPEFLDWEYYEIPCVAEPPVRIEPCCVDWPVQIEKINGPIVLQSIRTGCDCYDGIPFRYCPWCGKARPQNI